MKIIQAKCATSQFVKRLDIYFDEHSGLIDKVENANLTFSEVDFYFSDDYLLFAGMGDIHIHAREDVSGKNNYKEDFQSTCCAALSGGVVHVADMPNNPIPPIDDESYLSKFNLAAKKSQIPILMYAGIGPKTKPLSFKVPYKVYMGPSIGDLYFKDDESLDQVLKDYRDQFVSFHCEDPVILEEHKNEKTHETRRPVSAELMATKTAISFIRKYNLKGKLCHYSSGIGLSLIKAAKKEGLSLTCEVTPQHLYYSLDELLSFNNQTKTLFQMNPPIRNKSDQNLLLDSFLKGEIDYLATDHAPHSVQEKMQGMSGLPGLDTYGPFVTWLLLEKNMDPKLLAIAVSENPGRFFNQFLNDLNHQSDYFKKWGKGMGFLEKGFSASFTIFNLLKSQKIEKPQLKTKSEWSPFLGETFPGSVECVFLAGVKQRL